MFSQVREHIKTKLGGCGPALPLSFSDVKCLDCGSVADRRLLPAFCHLPPAAEAHAAPVAMAHPGAVERYHADKVHASEHPRPPARLWYGALIGRKAKRHPCCGRRAGKPGCVVKWGCCGEVVAVKGVKAYDDGDGSGGCRGRHACCGQEECAADGGCQPRFVCCGGRPDAPGCVLRCRKCEREWGSAAEGCTRGEHLNVVEEWEEEEEEEEEEKENEVEVKMPEGKKRRKFVLGLQPIVLEKPF